MTIESTLSKAVFLGNDTAVDFPFSFKVWEASQLAVIYTDPAGRDSPVSGFTVELNATGGVLHYMRNGQPLPTGHRLTIMRNMPFTQGIDLVSASRFDPQVMEDGMDQACAERQQLLEELDRAVKVPPSSDSTPEDLVHDIFDARNQAADSAANAAASEVNAADSAAAAADSAAHASAEADRATTQADRAQSLVEIGPATTKSLGFVQIGEGIAVTEGGVISVTQAGSSAPGTPGTMRFAEDAAVVDGRVEDSAVKPRQVWNAALNPARDVVAKKYTSAGVGPKNTGFMLADGTDIAALFGKIDDVENKTSGSGSFITGVNLSVNGKIVSMTQSKGTPGYCSYCGYCSHCGYCTYCSNCTSNCNCCNGG